MLSHREQAATQSSGALRLARRVAQSRPMDCVATLDRCAASPRAPLLAMGRLWATK